MASISTQTLVPSIMDPIAFRRYMLELTSKRQDRLAEICPSLPPSGFDPNRAEDYWHFLSRGKNLDVRL